MRKHSPTPDERSPRERGTPSPRDGRLANGSEYSRSPKDCTENEAGRKDRSPVEANGRSPRRSSIPKDNGSPFNDDENQGSPRGSE